MLETIRAYAWERLLESDESSAVRQRHAEYFVLLAEEAAPKLAHHVELLERLRQEHANFRAALAWSLETRDAELGMRLAGALRRFWLVTGHLREGREHATRLLALPAASAHPAPRARALLTAGHLASMQADREVAQQLLEESLEIHRDQGDLAGMAAVLVNLGNIAAARGEHAAAQTLYEQTVALARQTGQKEMMAGALGRGAGSDPWRFRGGRGVPGRERRSLARGGK
jgi:tetratricopeptide (TPR) repeat protein